MRGSYIFLSILLLSFGVSYSSDSTIILDGIGTLFLNGYGQLSMEVDGKVKLEFDNVPGKINLLSISDDKSKPIPKLDELSRGVEFEGKIEFREVVKFILDVDGVIKSFKFVGEGSGNLSGERKFNIDGKDGKWKKDRTSLNIGKFFKGSKTTM
ncbi:MAG: hypothetical protein ACUVWP_05765 [bacterium]